MSGLSESELQRVAEIAERAEKATPGPWTHDWYEGEAEISGDLGRLNDFHLYYEVELCPGYTKRRWDEPTGNFIAKSREDVPFLLALVKRQAAALERLEGRPVDPNTPCSVDDPPFCDEHGGGYDGWYAVGEGQRCSKVRAALTESTEGTEPDAG